MTDEAPKTFADGDFRKFFADMKLPALPDMESLMAANRRNMEALSAANRVALEGAQAVARRHMEIMQQSMTDLTESVRTIAATEGSQAKAAKQADMLKAAYERAVTNMRELADLIQRSNSEAMGVINKRFAEAMDEVKTLIEKAKAPG
jgi:phasin family protein